MKRSLLLAAAAVGVVLVLAVGVLAWLVETRSGLDFAWSHLEARLPGEVRIGELDGRLAGPLIVKGLVLETDSLRIEIGRAELDWRPLGLLHRKLDADRLVLANVEVTQRPAPASAASTAPFSLPDSLALPVDVDIAQVLVTQLDYFSAPKAEPITIEQASLGLGLDMQQWHIRDIDVRGPLFTARGKIALVPRGSYATQAQLDWSLRPPGYPVANGRTTISGDRERVTLVQSIAAPYSLDAQLAVIQPFGAGRLDGQLKTSLKPQALGLDLPIASIDANASVAGSLQAVGIDAQAQLRSEELSDLHLVLDARYSQDKLQVQTLQLLEPDSMGRLRLSGSIGLGAETRVDLDGGWKALAWPPNGPPVVSSPSGSLQLSGAPDSLKADLSAEVGGRGNLSGTIRRDGSRLTADLSWRDIAWPASSPEASSRSGKLSVTGSLDDYRLELDTDLALAKGPRGQIRAAGAGNLKGLRLEQVDAHMLGGSLEGQAAARWSPELGASAELTASNLNPGVIEPDWPGRLGGRLSFKGSMPKEGLSVQLEALQLHGRLRRRALAVDASGSYAAKDLHIAKLEVKSGASELHASGALGDKASLSFRLASPDLADLCPGCAGKLSADGSIEGPSAMPVVSLDARGGAIKLPDAVVGDLDMQAKVDTAGVAQSTLELSLENAQVAGTQVSELHAKGSGNAAAHELSLSADTGVGRAQLALEGRVEQPWKPGFTWRFAIDRANLAYPQLAAWVLQGKAAGRLSAAGAELDQSCWHSGASKLCLDAAGSGLDDIQAHVALTALPFAYFKPLLSESLAVSGQLSGTAALRLAPKRQPQIEVTLDTTPGRIGPAAAAQASAQAAAARAGPAPSASSRSVVSGTAAAGSMPDEANIPGLAFGAGTGHIVSNTERTTIDVAWPFEQQGELNLHGVVDEKPGVPWTESTIDGNAAVQVNDLSFIDDIADQTNDTTGKLAGKLTLSGTLAAPRLVGRVALEDVRTDLIAPGITVQNFNLALIGDGSGEVKVEASAESGDGSLTGTGRLALQGASPVGRLVLTGKRFELYDTSDARVFVSPQLTIDAAAERIDLTGQVMVPAASFTPRAIPQGAVAVSPDQVIVGEEQNPGGPSSLLRPLYAKVQLQLGDDVTIEGLGLTGTLGGGVQIVEGPGQPTTGTGELRVEKGTYKAYGQDLTIRKGRLIFAGGPLTNPGLDVEAVRQATKDILVGARVQGTLMQPELSLFSEPPLPQQEQLSYLVLGRSLNNASSSQNSALASAALALGLKGGNFVSDRLNKSLGFQEFGIETQPGEGSTSASFVIGKYLSPSLYVSYGIGLFQPINTLKLRYTISSHWRLETESSSQAKGGDLLYHVERGE